MFPTKCTLPSNQTHENMKKNKTSETPQNKNEYREAKMHSHNIQNTQQMNLATPKPTISYLNELANHG